MSSYIAPQKDINRYTCPHCGTISMFSADRTWFAVGLSHIDKKEKTKILTIHRCLNCGDKVVWKDDEYIYPDKLNVGPNPDMPESVRALFDEAALIAIKSPRAACALLRLAVERLCVELGVDEGSIDKNIAKLVERGLSVEIQQALDVVRVVGNKAVHPGQISMDVEDVSTAKTLMTLLNIITERMISEPLKIQGCFDTLPQNVKDAIGRRNK